MASGWFEPTDRLSLHGEKGVFIVSTAQTLFLFREKTELNGKKKINHARKKLKIISSPAWDSLL